MQRTLPSLALAGMFIFAAAGCKDKSGESVPTALRAPAQAENTNTANTWQINKARLVTYENGQPPEFHFHGFNIMEEKGQFNVVNAWKIILDPQNLPKTPDEWRANLEKAGKIQRVVFGPDVEKELEKYLDILHNPDKYRSVPPEAAPNPPALNRPQTLAI